MTNNRRFCKVCGEYSGKSKVCYRCKKEQPRQQSEAGQMPFRREGKCQKKNK